MAATALVNKVNPPEIRQVYAPWARMVMTSSRPPDVGVKKLLAPEGLGLHHDVDRQIAARLAQAVLDLTDIVAAAEGYVDRHFVEQPLRGAGRGKNGARAVDHRAIERGVGGIADQR